MTSLGVYSPNKCIFKSPSFISWHLLSHLTKETSFPENVSKISLHTILLLVLIHTTKTSCSMYIMWLAWENVNFFLRNIKRKHSFTWWVKHFVKWWDASDGWNDYVYRYWANEMSPYAPDSFQLSKNLHTPLRQITVMVKWQIAFIRNTLCMTKYLVEFDYNQSERKSPKFYFLPYKQYSLEFFLPLFYFTYFSQVGKPIVLISHLMHEKN